MNSEDNRIDSTFVATAQAEKEMEEILQSAFTNSSAVKKKGTSSSKNIRTQSQFVATPEAEKEMDELLQTVFRHSSAAITKGTSLSIKTRTQSHFMATPDAEKEMDELFQTVFRHSSPSIKIAESDTNGNEKEVDGEIPPLVDSVDSDDDDVESQPHPQT